MDSYLAVDSVKLAKLTAEKPWMSNPTWFSKVKVSAAAASKMLTHAASGVDKGLKSSNAMPVEVMGLMVGHVDTDDPHSLIVTDTFPLPVEGTETTVMTDNPEVVNYMIQLSDSLEAVREEHFMGWYHSHPFDVCDHSNAFLSATDVSTQLSWQLPEDRAGNPWLALVVDPLRCVAKSKPEIGAFRCYPPDHRPAAGLAPDGVVWEDTRARNTRWGESCMSYYQLEVEYFVTGMAASLMGILARDFAWARVLSSAPMLEKEHRDRLAERLNFVRAKAETATASLQAEAGSVDILGFGGVSAFDIDSSSHSSGLGSEFDGATAKVKSSDLQIATKTIADLSSELARGHLLQSVKAATFAAVPVASSAIGTASAASTSLAGAP